MDVAGLFARHHEELYRYAARFTGDADVAEDVVQEAFVRLAVKPPRDPAHVRAWLYRVVTTVAVDTQRAGRRRTRLVEERGSFAAADPAPDPAAATETAELRERVRAALAGLKEKERAVLLLREQGFAHREIAAMVGTTTGSVGTMIARALDKLAQRLALDAEDVT